MGLNHHLPLHTSVQIVAILKKRQKDNDTFISIVNKLEHKYEVPCHVSVVEVFPLQGKATNLNFLWQHDSVI